MKGQNGSEQLPDATEQGESRQVYVAICDCNAILREDSPATSEFPLRSLTCRECCACVPAHLVTLPFRGYGIANLPELGR